ncbi:uncharacterized protein LOC128212509 [Mya arenaria]|uniref:uncharacterized protein LOC128212509 n=1 Tax=Mya arenaria TaxID=6604 RepID=UPI0022E907B5|nr:uncharacterized protein LOC128212509 [Mya arenaria]
MFVLNVLLMVLSGCSILGLTRCQKQMQLLVTKQRTYYGGTCQLDEADTFLHTGPEKSSNAETILTIWGTLNDLLGIIDFNEGRLNSSKISQDKLLEIGQEIISEITNRIDVATEHIWTEIQLSLKLTPIYDISFAVKSILTDVGFYVKVNGREKDYYRSILVEPDPHIIIQLRRLAPRLEEKNTNNGKTLLQCIADDNRCNITAINKFRDFYITQIENALLIETVKKKLRFGNITLDVEKRFWRKQIERVKVAFAIQIKRCEGDFPRLMKEDILVYDTPEALLQATSARYAWKCDVFFLKNTNQQLFIQGETEFLFMTEANGTRKAVVCAKTASGNGFGAIRASRNTSSTNSSLKIPIVCIKIRYRKYVGLDKLHAGNLLWASSTDEVAGGYMETTFFFDRKSTECFVHTELFQASYSGDIWFQISVLVIMTCLKFAF